MFKVPNEFKVGVVATIAIVLALLGYNVMRGKNAFNRENIFYARYDDVGGLALAAHVRYNGMNVGRVQDMNLSKSHPGQIVVSMNVSPDLKVPKGSVAKIVQIDLFGTKALQIDLAQGSTYLRSGDTLLSDVDADMVDEVKAQATSLLASLDSVVQSVKETFNDNTKKNLQHSIASIQQTLDVVDHTMSDNQSRLNHIFSNVESITSNLSANNDQVTAILSNLNAITDSMKRADITHTIAQARDALEQVSGVMQKINEGKGSMGMLLNDDKLYNNLAASSRSLDELLKDLKDHPGRYVQFSVFGKKDKTKDTPPQN